MASEETPSKLLRQLSRALAPDQQITPLRQKVGTRRRVSTPRTPRTRRTSIIHLTPNATPPGFVQKSHDDITNNYSDQVDNYSDQVDQLTETIEFTREIKLNNQDVNDDEIIDINNDQDTETMEFTREIKLNNDQDTETVEFTREIKLNNQDVNADEIIDINNDQDTETIEFTKEIKLNNQYTACHQFGRSVCAETVAGDMEELSEFRFNEDMNADEITDIYNTETMESTGEIIYNTETMESTGEIIYNTETMESTGEIIYNTETMESTGEINTISSKPRGQPQLPQSLIKKVFNSFSNAKLSKTAMQAVFEGTQLFFEQITTDLATYAAHGKREIIQDKDVLLLMKRQGLINDKISFEHLAERHLPRELLDEVCVVARAGN
ncbi:171_t:CDS:2, partial [Dentiscutata erythropus]